MPPSCFVSLDKSLDPSLCSRSHVASPPLPSPFQDASSCHSAAQLVTARRCRRRELSALICGFPHPASCTVHTKRGFCFPCPQSTAIAHLCPFTSCSPGSHHQTRGTARRQGASRGCTGQGCARSQEGKGKVTACHPGPRHQPHFTVQCALWQCFCE